MSELRTWNIRPGNLRPAGLPERKRPDPRVQRIMRRQLRQRPHLEERRKQLCGCAHMSRSEVSINTGS